MSLREGLPSSSQYKRYDLDATTTSPKAAVTESVKQNTEELLPSYKGDITHILPEPPKIGKHDDDLLVHQDRINAIDGNLSRACDAVQKIFREIGSKVQKEGREWPALNQAMEKLVQDIDAARSQAAHGHFAEAEKTCSEALEIFQQAYDPLEREFSDRIDANFDKEILSTLFAQAKDIIKNSLDSATGISRDCEFYLAELNKAASVVVEVPDKSIVEAAFKELHNARESLQEILDGKKEGNVEKAKEKVKEAASKCHDLCWVPGNAVIAKKQMIGKAQLAVSLIPKATAEKVIDLATQKFGTLEKPGIVLLEGTEYEVAHDLLRGGFQVIRLPREEEILGKGAWNVVVRVCNVSNKCFQALRKPISPSGEQPLGEEHILHSIEIYKDIGKLQGTTVGPEALIRKGTGGVLSSLYSDDVIKWLRMMPTPELRWECFQSVLGSFIEFAKAGNVHGDIHPGNLSVVYDNKRAERTGVYAVPGTLKIEDLDGACHIIEGVDAEKNPIYSKKAAEVGIVCKFATQLEVDEWIKCLQSKDLKGIADVRFGQDILAMGITLYQILTLDFDIDNLYLNKECSPFTDMEGKVVEGKFEEGIFREGKPNLESVRFALEEYKFLTSEQKGKIIEFIALTITQNTKQRARLQDLELAVSI